ncbi:MAG TPA: hypothetical protein VF785_00905, partial [Gemmatimonadaceae bacterium]
MPPSPRKVSRDDAAVTSGISGRRTPFMRVRPSVVARRSWAVLLTDYPQAGRDHQSAAIRALGLQLQRH